MCKVLLKWMLILFPFVSVAQTTTNCFDIQSILVDACGSNEGNNELVRFLVGPNNLNTANMNVVWANTSNAWLGVCQNATTAGYVSQLNSTIVNCGLLIEPTGGILPANKKVILVSGINFDPTAASFANLTDTLYMIFHCGSATAGNFANVGAGIRNFSMSFTSPGGNCNDAVSYDRSLLPGGNGATVEYTFAGTASYTNYGCNVPVIPLSAEWTQPQPLCQGDAPLNLNTLITGTPGGTWSGQGVTGNTFSPAGLSGNIAITYTVGSANCSVEEEKFIVVNQGGTATWTIPPPVCTGNSIADLNTLVTGTAGGTWSGQGVTGTTFNSTGLLGNIALTYAVGSGTCAAQLTQNVNVVAAPNANWNFSSPTICSSEAPINLNSLVTGDLGGVWSGSGVTGNQFSPAGLLGNITVTYTLGSGTCSDVEERIINVLDAPSASWIAPNTLCQNQAPIDLNALVTGSLGGTFTGTGVVGNIFSPAGLNGVIEVTYTVGSGACLAINQQEIQVNPTPAVPAISGDGTFCTGTTPTNLTANGANSAQFTWFTDANLTNQFGTGASILPTQNLTQTYYLIQTVNSCASASAQATVTFTASPAAPTLPAVVQYCSGALPLLTVTGSASNFIWFSDASLNNQIGTGASFQTTDGTITTYFVVAEEASCRSASASTQIQLGAEVVATITPSGNLVICNNQSITLTSSSNTGNVWSTLATSPSIEVTTSGEYTLTVTGVCNTDVATVTVSNGSVTADFSASPQNGPAPLTSIITDESENGDQIIWTINGESVNIISGADRVFEAGEYEVQQLVISTEGCRDSIIRVIKSISDLVELLVPNSFTPNGDSKNDTFKAVTFGIVELEGSIYNRWGEQIFSWEGPNNGWDGRTKGRMSPDGVYFYLITAKDTFQKAHEKYGSITLLR
jgi:gliding motility-associated-like protein